MSLIEARDGIVIGPDDASPLEPRNPLLGFHSHPVDGDAGLPSSFAAGAIHDAVFTGIPYVNQSFVIAQLDQSIGNCEGLGIIDCQVTGDGEVTVRIKNHGASAHNSNLYQPGVVLLSFRTTEFQEGDW